MLCCALSKTETTFGMALFAPIWHHAIRFPANLNCTDNYDVGKINTWWVDSFGTSKLARAFSARFIRFISRVFALFNFFLSCLYIVPLPKILASRLVASLRNTEHEQLNASRIEKKNLAHIAWRTKTYCLLSFLSFTPWILHYSIFKKCKRILAVRARLYVSICIHRYMQSFQL